MFQRLLKKSIGDKFFQGKVILLIGARQTGKTTLSSEILKEFSDKKEIKIFNGDNPTDRELLGNKDLEFLKGLTEDADFILIDEGQKIENIGQTLKLLVDHYKNKKQIIVTGSSSFHLLDSTSEPLTGRKHVYTLYPLSIQEIYGKDYLALTRELETLLVFGSYPEIAGKKTFESKIELLKELTSSYLYRDILEFQQIKNPDILRSLLKALALQIGSEVSYNELSKIIGIDKKTIERYVDLLEKSFVIFRLSPYNKNKRKEISKLKKIYFYDLGIRNALINNFNFLDSRNDTGGLWENFLMTERLKYRAYHSIYADQYFWRTYEGGEVDLVEEREGKLFGYEFKWSEKSKKLKPPQAWLEYSKSSYEEINSKKLKGFIL